MRITVDMPIEDGEVVAKAIERMAESGDQAIGLELAAGRHEVHEAGVAVEARRDARDAAPNGWRAQQADALLAMAKGSLAGVSANIVNGAPGENGGTASDNYLVVVHTDEESLRGGIGRADLPIETIRRLTCDGSIVKVLEDHEGTPLDVGRKQRVVSTKLRRALLSRDRCCTFPGCRNRLFVHAHHVEHWATGGATDLGNLMLLCSHHHRLVHEGGFTIQRDASDRPYFVRPDGRVIPRAGYRLEDMVDDDVDAGEFPSAEAWARMTTHDPSAEVREGRGHYVVMTAAA